MCGSTAEGAEMGWVGVRAMLSTLEVPRNAQLLSSGPDCELAIGELRPRLLPSLGRRERTIREAMTIAGADKADGGSRGALTASLKGP